MVRVFANGPGDLDSISGRVITKTQKMVLDASLLNTQHYMVRIKGKVEQSKEMSSTLPYTLMKELLTREPSGHPWLRSPTLLCLMSIFIPFEFFTPMLIECFLQSLLVSRTFLSIRADLKVSVVWMVSVLSQIFNSPNLILGLRWAFQVH